MPQTVEQLEEVRRKVRAACLLAGREPSGVTLVAVSKTFPPEDIRTVFEAGHVEFGESRLQEAAPKIECLPEEIEWHFIGRVQRNKVRKILPHFSHIHAVDSLKLASHIDSVAQDMGMRPKIFLQVNQANEESKGGFTEKQLLDQISEIGKLKHLNLVGLMTIPPIVERQEDSRKWFAALREFRDRLQSDLAIDLPCLSMGMSGDYEVAIEEGATHVRVGSAIFGKRDKKIPGELG